MRRRDKEITDRKEIDEVLTKVKTGRLGTCSRDIPYVTPMNFAYDSETLKIFLHCANEGKKLENIRVNQNVCFEVDDVADVIVKQPTCASSVAYRSVILFGTIKELIDLAEKNKALQKIAEKYAPQNPRIPFADTMLTRTNVLEIQIMEMTAKRSPARPAYADPSKK
ncbi:MAG: pyridoxamine 5'-phosphate oxidase family protein [Candidatus Kuenenia sp.]|nr:pyridoxamine 5'-phosphate oxidase family protein [Candidatus Kuenenia hertensis]